MALGAGLVVVLMSSSSMSPESGSSFSLRRTRERSASSALLRTMAISQVMA